MGLTWKRRPVHELKAFRSEILNLGWLIFVVLRTADSAPPPLWERAPRRPLVVEHYSLCNLFFCTMQRFISAMLQYASVETFHNISQCVWTGCQLKCKWTRNEPHTVTSVATRVTCSRSGFIVSLQYSLDLKVCFFSALRGAHTLQDADV